MWKRIPGSPAHALTRGWMWFGLAAAVLLAGCDTVPLERRTPSAPSVNLPPGMYEVFGERYTVLETSRGYLEIGVASWYGEDFHGRLTANGETYDMNAVSAAHKTLPLPTWVRVTNLDNGRKVILRINDRGPFHDDRLIDLSRAAAVTLGFADQGTAPVVVEALEARNYEHAEAATGADAGLASVRFDDPGSAVAQAPVAAGNYYLQAGAFTVRDGAEQLHGRITQLLQSLEHALAPVNILPTERQNGMLYKVWIGPIAGDDKRMIIARALRGAGFSDPIEVEVSLE